MLVFAVSLIGKEISCLEGVIQVQDIIFTCVKRIVFNLASDGAEVLADVVRLLCKAFNPEPFVLAVEGDLALAEL